MIVGAWSSAGSLHRLHSTRPGRTLTHTIGAEIGGVDLSTELSDQQFDEIRHAWLENLVVIFRDQQMTSEQHKRLRRRFGALHVHPLNAVKPGKDPEIFEVKAGKHSRSVAGEGWHTDVSCDAEPPMGSMLYVTQMPEGGIGGDTMFANMYLAYDMLSDRLKSLLEGMTAIHDGAIPYVGNYKHKAPEGGFPTAEHPIVVRHPETGRKLLFVNRGFTSRIVQLTSYESRCVLEMLYRMIELTPPLVCRIPWTLNSMVFWDNRCTQHHAVWDYYPLNRYGQRVTIAGQAPSA
ncbi:MULTISPECIES: TauD/TfdA dioxygenase family protein [Paraburkholderia]|nr:MULTISPECIES: TauD/TfdA family dioxygenase [Paraburkholderia]MCX4174684.1 TauD/TfdA family dioxygenase [Paraburkholderia madseniana]